jgi:hypothetical protein
LYLNDRILLAGRPDTEAAVLDGLQTGTGIRDEQK